MRHLMRGSIWHHDGRMSVEEVYFESLELAQAYIDMAKYYNVKIFDQDGQLVFSNSNVAGKSAYA